ncbi:MAG: hypothetical protein K9G48_15020 [Reyranella sp.]|nr:hypothetical protein [Reyranella sp.]
MAGSQFYEPVLFGQVVDLLAAARDRSTETLWHEARAILGLSALVGLGGIAANIVVSLQADRMAHRRRLGAMAGFFEHVLALPFSFHVRQHSGRLIKVMLTGVDNLFGMLPLSLFMNWHLGMLLLVLILLFAAANVWIVNRTDRLQHQVEDLQSALDSVTEARIQKARKVLRQGRTTFVIAHRLSTIRDADLVVVVEHGRIVEQGGFQELTGRGGAFARLVATQQAGIESA